MQSFRHNLVKSEPISKILYCWISKKILYVPLPKKFPAHLKYVTVLPCEIWKLKTATELVLII